MPMDATSLFPCASSRSPGLFLFDRLSLAAIDPLSAVIDPETLCQLKCPTPSVAATYRLLICQPTSSSGAVSRKQSFFTKLPHLRCAAYHVLLIFVQHRKVTLGTALRLHRRSEESRIALATEAIPLGRTVQRGANSCVPPTFLLEILRECPLGLDSHPSVFDCHVPSQSGKPLI